MSSTYIYVKYRPVRIGFLVRQGNIQDLISAAQINTLLWGGIYNPIIPVNDNQEFSKQLIRLYHVDILQNISSDKKVQTFVDAHPFLRDPSFTRDKIFYEDWHTKKQLISYLDILPIIDHYWEKHFEHTDVSNCRYVKWEEDDDLSALFTMMFGMYANDKNLRYDYKKAFVNGMKAQTIQISKGSNINADLQDKLTPIQLTDDRLLTYGDLFINYGIFVGKADDYDDLLTFWNLRAAGIEVSFLPIGNTERLKDYIINYINDLDKRPSRHPNYKDMIGIYYRTEKEDIGKVVSFLKPNKKLVFCKTSEASWNGLNIKPIIPQFEQRQMLCNVDKKYKEYAVSIPLPEKPFSDKKRNHGYQEIIISIKSLTEFDYPGYSLSLPYLPELNEFYSREICIEPFKLRVEEEGIGLIEKSYIENIEVYPIKNIDLMIKLFQKVGIKAETSQAGLLANQIIKNMGGIEGCRVFKIQGVRDLIKETDDRGVSWGDATNTIYSKNFKKYEDLYIESRKKAKLRSSDAWLYLIKNRVFIPERTTINKIIPKFMLRSIKFSCKECGLNSVIPVSAFEGTWKCKYCQHEHYMPKYIGEIRSLSKKLVFKKTGLFAKRNNQEGSIPVILSIMQILRAISGPSNGVKWATAFNLNLGKAGKCEIDYLILDHRPFFGKKMNGGSVSEVLIGECKDQGGEIDDKDIDNLKEVRRLFENEGIKCTIAFSKTAEKFLDREIIRFKKLSAEGILPILFTNDELEPDDPYYAHPKNHLLLHQHAMTFDEIAENSKNIYLL